jgi:phosphatidate cytidylyltransferase
VALGNLASRFLVAVVAAPILLLAVYQRNPIYTWVIIFAASLVAMAELFAMTLSDKTDRAVSLVLGALAVAGFYWMHPLSLPHDLAWQQLADGRHAVLGLAVILPLLYYLFRYGDIATVAPRMAFTVLGIVYAGLLLTTVAELKRDGGPVGGDLVIFVLVVVWAGDTGAYFAGRFLGKHKLYPAVSPKKTWEGAIGGVLGSLAAGAAMKVFRLDGIFNWFDVVMLTIPGAALAQMGDLAESLLKRSVGVKDSGSILPGHGGILDRIDAVLFFAPYVHVYIQLRLTLAAM